MAVTGLGDIATRASGDGEWNLTARFWTGAVAVTVGDERTVIHLDDGHITSVEDGPAGTTGPFRPGPTDVTISVPPDVWDRMLEDPPRPHHQDLQAAQHHHGLELGGDELTTF